MTFIQAIAVSVYFGTPLLVLYRWIVLPRSRRRHLMMAAALALWLAQAAVLIVAVLGCIGGHCRVTTAQEYAVYAVVLGAFLGVGILLWLARDAQGR